MLPKYYFDRKDMQKSSKYFESTKNLLRLLISTPAILAGSLKI